ncbi:MAG: hypothetical protein ACO3N7_01955 [Kiritimatiellia bacterium]
MTFFWGLLILGFTVPVFSVEEDPVIRYDWGPFAASWEDAHGNQRNRYLGPFLEKIENEAQDTAHAFRPFYHRWHMQEDDFTRTEMLWPIWVQRQREESLYWRFLLNFYWNQDVNDPGSRWRLWLLPFYFQGRDAQGESYQALFPIAGSIHEFFFWDKIDFALFPLFIRSRINEIEANTVLWPIFSRTTGPGMHRFRIFPFYGFSERDGIGRKTFLLWPFFSMVHYTLPASPGRGWILFPLFGHLKLSNQETYWFLPPLFRYSVGEEQNRIYGPWPFFQREEGEVNKFYLFPLYGHKQHAGYDKRFFLWPLGQYESTDKDTGIRKKFHFIPFVQYFYENPSAPLEPESDGEASYLKIWPLFSHSSKQSGEVTRTTFLDLNPMRGGPIERNYAPFWQLYVHNTHEDRADTEILWGLYRAARRGETYRYRSLFPLFSYTRDTDKRHFQLLKGLIGRERVGEKKRWQLLYLFHFGDKELEP